MTVGFFESVSVGGLTSRHLKQPEPRPQECSSSVTASIVRTGCLLFSAPLFSVCDLISILSCSVVGAGDP